MELAALAAAGAYDQIIGTADETATALHMSAATHATRCDRIERLLLLSLLAILPARPVRDLKKVEGFPDLFLSLTRAVSAKQSVFFRFGRKVSN